MLKVVIKEGFITLLLCIAILLILGILLYDYIPTNQTIPTKEAYITPDTVKNEISDTVSESEKVEVTYEVTDDDLSIYEQTGSYEEGKANPFALEETTDETTNTSTNDINDTQQNVDSSDNKKEDENQQTTNTFWNDEGIK